MVVLMLYNVGLHYFERKSSNSHLYLLAFTAHGAEGYNNISIQYYSTVGTLF